MFKIRQGDGRAQEIKCLLYESNLSLIPGSRVKWKGRVDYTDLSSALYTRHDICIFP